jgi:hypothetical protein
MTIYTVLYIFFGLGLALVISYYQYFYKTKYKGDIYRYLAGLRTLTFFLITLLFINPKFKSTHYTVDKTNLVLVLDNSQSIRFLKAEELFKSVYNKFVADKDLKKKFNISSFIFGKNLRQYDSLNFKDTRTNIYDALKQIRQLYSKNVALVLFSDGNQTQGIDYAYTKAKFPLYTLVVGDTAKFTDLEISHINANEYTYLGNNFPVEIFLKHNLDSGFKTNLQISEKGKVVFSKNIIFSDNESSKIINAKLKTHKVGIHQYKVKINPLGKEKNLKNNSAYFSTTTLDENSNVLIYSSINHPDIGVLKRSIETNKQRQVSVVIGHFNISELNKYQLVILYQPNSDSENLFKSLQKNKKPYFVISGTKTNWSFLNKAQSIFSKKAINQNQESFGRVNKTYKPFSFRDLGFKDMPPLVGKFGSVKFAVLPQVLLYQNIGTFTTQQPLLATFKNYNSKGAVLFGENLWQWRMAYFAKNNNFVAFDNFINSLVQYLIELKSSSQLTVKYKSVVYANQPIEFWANYLDATKVFDSRAKLELTINKENTPLKNTYPLALRTDKFYLSLPNLNAGNYQFILKDKKSNLTQKGQFIVLNFPIEHQFYKANFKKLALLASKNKGQAFLLSEYKKLKTALLKNANFKSIQKKNVKTIPLLSFKWLLLLIVASAVTEWFLRKYHGLI